MVTREPYRSAAWSANPPQPDPISIRWSSGTELQFAGDHLEFGHLGLFETHSVVGEVGARIGHRGVQHEGEEVVGEVVVGSDVLAISILARGPEPLHPGEQPSGPSHRGVHELPQRGRSAEGEAHDCGEVVRVPPAGDVALGQTGRATAQRGGPCSRVVDHDRDVRITGSGHDRSRPGDAAALEAQGAGSLPAGAPGQLEEQMCARPAHLPLPYPLCAISSSRALARRPHGRGAGGTERHVPRAALPARKYRPIPVSSSADTPTATGPARPDRAASAPRPWRRTAGVPSCRRPVRPLDQRARRGPAPQRRG